MTPQRNKLVVLIHGIGEAENQVEAPCEGSSRCSMDPRRDDPPSLCRAGGLWSNARQTVSQSVEAGGGATRRPQERNRNLRNGPSIEFSGLTLKEGDFGRTCHSPWARSGCSCGGAPPLDRFHPTLRAVYRTARDSILSRGAGLCRTCAALAAVEGQIGYFTLGLACWSVLDTTGTGGIRDSKSRRRDGARRYLHVAPNQHPASGTADSPGME
jgi:hypothetical protein